MFSQIGKHSRNANSFQDYSQTYRPPSMLSNRLSRTDAKSVGTYTILYTHVARTIPAANIHTLMKSNIVPKQATNYSDLFTQTEQPPLSPRPHRC
jgi:hypothetical protein